MNELIGIMGFAYLGGLILNIMPCVLPVLALKAFNILKHQDKNIILTRLTLWATSLGILLSMFCLGLIVVGLRQTGQVFGWGAQFQDPRFIAMLMLCMLFFAAMLWDWVTIHVPAVISKLAPSALDARPLVEALVTGFFITLLATPCTAPFLGVAVGLAFVQSVPVIIMTFLSIGFGLASPYVLLSLAPQLVHYLPKPGAWMRHVKHSLGFLLLAMAIWLRFILLRQVQPVGLFALDLTCLLFVYCLWLKPRRGWLIILVALSVLSVYLAHHYRIDINQAQVRTSPSASRWIAFDADLLTSWIQEDKLVLVNITAEWCITCKANEQLVFNTREFAALVNEYDVRLMEGDYTNPDPVLFKFIQHHQRFGVPVYVVYGPTQKQGLVLPELLTLNILRSAFKDATARTDL